MTVFISPYITNTVFIVTVYLSGYQHVQLKRPNPLNLQFWMIAFCLAMMLVVAFANDDNRWLSLGFFATSIGCLALMIRMHRMLPPRQPFE